MKITKLVAISLTSAFIFGCNDSSNTDTIETITPSIVSETSGNSIALTDNSIDDSGKVTYTLDNALESGSVSVNVKYAAGESETTYVTLFDAAVESSSMIANIKMDSGFSDTDGLVGIRLSTLADDQLTTASFAEDTWVTITVIWTSTTYTVSVDGAEIGTWDVINENAVSAIQMKLGNNSNTTDYTFYVDDIEIYSDTVASIEVLNENFDEWVVGEDVANMSNYTENTTEAIITNITNGTKTSEDDSEQGDFPSTLDEFNFSNGSYDNSGSATISLASVGDVITNTIGATGIDDTALNLAQDSTTNDYGYLYYTNTASAGAGQITGSFSTEIVMQLSSDESGSDHAYSSDVSLIDYVNTDYFIGFKTYLEKDDHSIKFKIYGGAIELGESGISTEVQTYSTLVSDTWYHIMSVYNADDTSIGEYGSITIYVNGIEEVTQGVDFEPVENEAVIALDDDNVAEVDGVEKEDKLIVAGSTDSENKNLNGDLDNVAIWNVALTPAQVSIRSAAFELY